jgi:glycosyltransferase involved in cell wall biosynthesis
MPTTLANNIAAEIAAPVTESAYPLRVAYDAQAFLSPNGGTGKGIYLRNLIAPYAESFSGLATNGRKYFDYPLIQGGFSRYHLWHQFSVPRTLKQLQADVFLAPYNTAPLSIPKSTSLLLVLHDLILLERLNAPTLKQRVDNEYRRFLIPRAVSRARIVITVSNYVKADIQKRFPSARVEMIPNTIAPSWFVRENAKSAVERDNFLLAVTSSAPHKNAHRALEAYAGLVAKIGRTNAPQLCIVGLGKSGGAYGEVAASLRIADLVEFQSFLTETQLQDLYRRARAVLIPSLMEGFGIPVLEAMASGTPVIASNTTSLPEVGGAAAEYFDPCDVPGMTAAMERVLIDPAAQQKMIELGLRQSEQFHPDTVGRQIKNFWDALAIEAASQASKKVVKNERSIY